MQPQFNPLHNGDNSELLCPSCGGNYLHHELVEVFERAEDEDKGIRISVEDGRAKIDTSLTGNPSARRHGVSIHFSCEGCSAKPILTLAQHKGNTLVDFKQT